MSTLKHTIILLVVFLISGCSSLLPVYSNASSRTIPYQYRSDPSVKRAYREEVKAIRAEEKSIAECLARNKARMDFGRYPTYPCFPYSGYFGIYTNPYFH